MMSEAVDRAVDAQIDAYRPETVPPFELIEARRRRRDRTRLAAAAAAVAAVSLAFALPVLSNTSSDKGESPAAASKAVQLLRPQMSSGAGAGASMMRHWSTLTDVLPNVTYTYDGHEQRVTDSVVVGRVTRTEPARGYLGQPLVEGEDGRSRIVAFDDPRAQWRDLSVTVDVSETLAGDPVNELVLDWPIMGSSQRGEDADAVGQALKDLGTLVVLSKASPDGPEFVTERTTLELGYGIGVVAADNALNFPLIAADEPLQAAAFQDGIDTLAELRAEARKPQRNERVVLREAP
jgi:hypothetical protein